MTDEIKKLRVTAEQGRTLYRTNTIAIAEAKKMVMPYIKAVNERSVELAKKYGVRPRKINFYSYVR